MSQLCSVRGKRNLLLCYLLSMVFAFIECTKQEMSTILKKPNIPHQSEDVLLEN